MEQTLRLDRLSMLLSICPALSSQVHICCSSVYEPVSRNSRNALLRGMYRPAITNYHDHRLSWWWWRSSQQELKTDCTGRFRGWQCSLVCSHLARAFSSPMLNLTNTEI